MSQEITNLTNALERKLTLLHELTEELCACRAAFVGMNLEAIYAHIAKQAQICEQLREIESTRAVAWQAISSSVSEPANNGTLSSWVESLEPAIGTRLRQALTGLAVAEGEVRHVNHIHSILLQGTRRTLNMLSNAMATLSPIYAPPAILEDVCSMRRRA
jgi:hypothetical protein